jgi:1-acyl-sn-glycerol-3-phosphate acyltransferase
MLRLIGVSAAVAAITAALIPPQWLAVRLRWPARRKIPVLYHRTICALLGVRTHVVGTPSPASRLLIVSNHVSWLDISVLVSLAPVVFVAKREVAGWPLFGLLAKLNRSVFVDRERRTRTAAVNQEIAARLGDGDPVVLFAEGTSSDGNRVLPFRSSLIGAAQAGLAQANGEAAPVIIQPLSIVYVGLDGVAVGRQHLPQIAWYGAMDLLPHLARIIRHGAIDVTVSWGAPIAVGPDSDRKALARRLEGEVRELAAAVRRPPPRP